MDAPLDAALSNETSSDPADNVTEASAASSEHNADESQPASDDAVASVPDEPSEEDGPEPDGYTREGVPIGFGVGMSPPRAQPWERCCYCPIYNKTSGEVLAWIPHPPKYPRRAAAAYARELDAIEERHRRIEAVVGRTIDSYHQSEQV